MKQTSSGHRQGRAPIQEKGDRQSPLQPERRQVVNYSFCDIFKDQGRPMTEKACNFYLSVLCEHSHSSGMHKP